MLFLPGCGSVVKKFDERLTQKYEDIGFSSEILDTNRSLIHYWDNKKENAPVILFVHGFGGDGKLTWQQQAKVFSEDYRVIIPDILWFGESTSSKKPVLSSQIHMLKALIHELELENVHLCGISYGGFIVLGYAGKYPDDLASLCIVDSPGNVITDDEIEDFCDRVGVDNVKEAFVPETSSDVKRLIKFSFYDPPFLPGFIRKQTLGIYFGKNPEEQRNLLDDLPQNRGDMPTESTVPTLILWGREDAIFKMQNARDLKEELEAELTVFDKVGHALPYEQNKAFNDRYKTFLKTK